jgi:RNA polymerase sigma-70 factor (ECF subfamily)
MAEERVPAPASFDEMQAIAGRFVIALSQGDVEGMLAMLHEDVTVNSDGGGKVRAVIKPISGAKNVLTLFTKGRFMEDYVDSMYFATINHTPGLIGAKDGRITTAGTFTMQDGRIRDFYFVANPDKLTHMSLDDEGILPLQP